MRRHSWRVGRWLWHRWRCGTWFKCIHWNTTIHPRYLPRVVEVRWASPHLIECVACGSVGINNTNTNTQKNVLYSIWLFAATHALPLWVSRQSWSQPQIVYINFFTHVCAQSFATRSANSARDANAIFADKWLVVGCCFYSFSPSRNTRSHLFCCSKIIMISHFVFTQMCQSMRLSGRLLDR